MTKDMEKGDAVAWRSSQGTIEGTLKKLSASVEIEGRRVAASKDDLQYLVKNDRTGAVAARLPDTSTKKD